MNLFRGMVILAALVLVPFVLPLAGCGGGGGAQGNDAGTGGDATLPGTGTVTWREPSGVTHQATFATATMVTSTMRETWMLTASEPGGYAVSFGVSMAPPLVTGTYTCAQTGAGGVIVTLTYVTPVTNWQAVDCTIGLTTIGVPMQTHSMGSFSSTLMEIGGSQTAMISQGMFDAALTGASL